MTRVRVGRVLLDWIPPRGVRYPGRDIPKEVVSASGWVAPMGPAPSEVPERVDEPAESSGMPPFRIGRTPSKELPVYVDYKNGGTRVMTLVRRVRGDVQSLREDMSRICGGKNVTVRPGRLEVKGNYREELKTWFTRLGF
uniref:Large ribosomal subunit protein mL49 n=1 Tax=Compsopogon caeruleus TaxID=31354 RepID=A0A7S1TH73_9RHOD|mmetsp:Transcript_6725/g.13656  ORF Transcript_6725/g.13656 Transcript_6725/m.13656 type:complete len:140 (+) Transcript_6725:35-454(+)